jgi:hypothetical protein
MGRKKETNSLLIERVKLLMKYNSSKTLTENELLLEQGEPESRFETQQTKDIVKTGEDERIENEKQQKENEVRNTYPNYCKYKDKANPLPEKCGKLKKEGQETELELLKQFCYYSAPSMGFNEKTVSKTLGITGRSVAVTENGSKTQGYFIPNNAEITFWDIEKIDLFYNQILKRYPNGYKSKNEKQSLLSNISEILPIDSIRNFTINGNKYTTWLTLPDNGVRGWVFKGFYSENNKSPYITPSCVDDRNEYQKFIDDWGTTIQWSLVVVTAMLGAATGGATWALTAEILAELGVGIAVGIREAQKGENVSATLSFVTGALPMLKVFRGFRGVKGSAWREISEKLKTTKLETQDDYIKYYTELSEDGKLAWNQIVRVDERSRNALIKEINSEITANLPNIINNEFKLIFKNSPELIKKIPIAKRIWVRELGLNGIVGISALIANLFYGDVLNTQSIEIDGKTVTKEQLDSLFFNCPKELQSELFLNMFMNDKKTVDALANSQDLKQITKEESEKNSKVMVEIYQEVMKDTVITSGGDWHEDEESDIIADDIEYETYTSEQITKLRNDGWVPLKELKPGEDSGDESPKRVNNMFWVKPIKSNQPSIDTTKSKI